MKKVLRIFTNTPLLDLITTCKPSYVHAEVLDISYVWERIGKKMLNNFWHSSWKRGHVKLMFSPGLALGGN